MNNGLQRKTEKRGYNLSLIEDGRISFEEAKAYFYLEKRNKIEIYESEDSDDLGIEVNPDDLTHYSVYKDNTNDLKEIAKMAAQIKSTQSKPKLTNDENVVNEVIDDPFERFVFKKPSPQITTQMHDLADFSILGNSLIMVHESGLSKLRNLERDLGKDGTGPNQTISALKLERRHFFVESRLSSLVFVVTDLSADIETEEKSILKAVSPPSLWEAFILQKIKNICKTIISHNNSSLQSLEYSTPAVLSCIHYNDVVFFKFSHSGFGSLQNLKIIEELVVLFFAREILRILALLCHCQIVHSRISLEHLVLRSPVEEKPLGLQYSSDGSNGWAERGICLVGFGKALDLQILSKLSTEYNKSFEEDWKASSDVLNQLLSKCSQPLQFASLWNEMFSLLKSSFISQAHTRQSFESLVAKIEKILCSPQPTSLRTLFNRLLQ